MSERLTHEEIKNLNFLKNKFVPIERVGEGTFSVVYKAIDKETYKATNAKNVKYVALKAITKTSSPSRIAEELRFLQLLEGKNNVIPLLGCYRLEDQIVAVFPHFQYTEFRDFLECCEIIDIQHFLYNLLISVKHIHSKRIIHRDLKPSNFLYNKETRKGMLIDFGLAQFEKEESKGVLNEVTNSPSKKPSTLFFSGVISRYSQPPGYYTGDTRPQMRAQRAGTRGFRAPEVLFRSPNQTKALDMWSVGVIFLILLTKQYPFFNSIDDTDAIVEIACIFGHNEMRRVAKYYNRVWKSNIPTCPTERMSFEKLVESLNPMSNLTSNGYDLLYRMLDLFSERRISAEDALNHPFFDDINKNQ